MHLEQDDSKAGRVLDRGRSERVDSMIDDLEVDQESRGGWARGRASTFRCCCATGRSGSSPRTTRTAADPRFTDEDLRLAEAFAARAAVAVDLSERVARDALRRVVERAGAGAAAARARAARRDGPGADVDPARPEEPRGRRQRRASWPRRRPSCASSSSTTLQDVRRLAVELRPKALDDFGLVPALERLVETFREQTGIEVDLESRLGERAPAVRGRDDALPDHAGGAHERRQARPREAREHRRSRAGTAPSRR